MHIGPDLKSAYAHCQRVTRTEATNFYYAFRTLPRDKRNGIYAAYAFCRDCDDIADGPLSSENKRVLLRKIRADLLSMKTATQSPVFIALNDTVKKFQIPIQYLEDIVDGVEMDLVNTRYKTFEDLKEYCYHVASVVGLITIGIFGYEDQRAKEYAVDLGIAMQMTNILRDIHEDSIRGRIYLPLDEMANFGYSEQDLLNQEYNEQFRSLMKHQVERTRYYFDQGRQLFPLISTESRMCIVMLHHIYSSILDRIEGVGFDVFTSRISLSKREKLLLLGRLWISNIPSKILRFMD